jgi:hypothetical protein
MAPPVVITPPNAPSRCEELPSYRDLDKGILVQVSASDVGADGLLTQSGASAVIGKLRTAGIIPTAPNLQQTNLNTKTWTAPEQAGGNANDPLAVYVQAQNTLITNIEAEYNYVKGYYTKAVECLVDAITEFTSAQNETARNTINTNKVTPYRTQSITFNKKLNLLLDVARKISETLLSDSRTYETVINSYNTEFANRKARLEEQSNILNSENSASELHKRMVDYTAEKNRAHNNLLTLYSCLNIVAIAMLFYIAK